MNKSIILLLLPLFYCFPTTAQILYCLNREEIGTLSINDDNTCTLTPIVKLPLIEGENNSMPDITLYPDGKIYILRGRNKLYEVDVKQQNFIFTDSIPVSEFFDLTSLEADKNGLFYFAGRRLGHYDFQSKETIIYYGENFEAAGDLVLFEDYLLVGEVDISISQVDRNTFKKINEINFSNLTNTIFALARANNTLYGSENPRRLSAPTDNPDTSRIYKINIEEETATLVCEILREFPSGGIGGSVIWGLTSEHHFRNNFEMYLDLDANNSSGRFINHFEVDTFCTAIVPLADKDVQVSANFPIDSIVIQVETSDLSATEQILTNNISIPATIQLDKKSATNLTLSARQNAAFSDFETVLRQLQYDLAGNPPDYLERTIAFRMYGGGQVADIARAWLEVDLGRTSYAGADVDTTICPNRGFMALKVLQGEDPNGYWSPPFNNTNPNNYLAQLDGPGVFQYITQTGECPADTASIKVTFHEVDSLGWTFGNSLRFLCSEEDTVWVDISINDEATYYWRGFEAPPLRPLTIEREFNDFEIVDANGCVQSGAYYAVYRENLQAITTTDQQTLNLCKGEIYTLNGVDYTRDTTICQTYQRAISGCDSTHCIELAFGDAPLTVIDTTICYGETYSLFGQEIGTSGVYNGAIARPNQCDSLVDVYLSVLPKKETVIDTLLKEGETIQVGDFTLDKARTYTINLVGENGCDSIVQITVDFTTSTQAFSKDAFQIRLIPNPAYTSPQLGIESEQSEEVIVSIFNVNGSLLYQQMENIQSGDNLITLGALPAGIFWVQVEGSRGVACVRGVKL